MITWPLLQAQFGAGYVRLRKFREVFRVALTQVLTVYPTARLNADGRGLALRHSPPPVSRRMVQVPSSASILQG